MSVDARFSFSYNAFVERSTYWEGRGGDVQKNRASFTGEIIRQHAGRLNQVVDPINGNTVTHLAAKGGNSFLVKALVSAGVDVRIENFAGRSVRSLIDSKGPTTAQASIVAFFKATRIGDLATIKELHRGMPGCIEAIAQTQFDERGLTALQSACFNETPNLELIKFLVETCKVDVNAWSQNRVAKCSHILVYKTRGAISVEILDYLSSEGMSIRDPAKFTCEPNRATGFGLDPNTLRFVTLNGKF